MIFSVNIKKLVSIVNPYEYTDPIITRPISQNEIDKAIEKDNVLSEDPQSWTRQKHISRIAYLVHHKDLSPVGINIGYPQKGDIPTNILEHGFHQLAAAIYNEQSKILADIKGDENIVSKLFGVDYETERKSLFSWDITDNDLKSTWLNPDFILTQIKERKQKFSSLAAESVWSEDFLSKIAENIFFTSNLITDGLKHNKDLLMQENFIRIFSNKVENIKELWTFLNCLYDKEETDNNDVAFHPRRKEVMDTFDKYVLHSKEKMVEIFNSPKIKQPLSFYEFLPNSLKLDKDILDVVHKEHLNKNNYEFIVDLAKHAPKKYFSDMGNVVSFINIFYKKEDYEKISPLLNNQENILSIFSQLNLNGKNGYTISALFKELPKDILNDKNFNIQLLAKNPYFYSHLAENIKADIDIINVAFKEDFKGKDGLVDLIPEQSYSLIKSEELKKNIIRVNHSILHKSQWPDNWEMKKEYLLEVGSRISNLEFNKIINYKEFLKDEILVSQLIKNNSSFIYHLPKEKQKNPKYILQSIAHDDSYNSFLKRVPSDLWLEREFCIKAFMVNQKSIEYIPKSFFNHKDFVLSFFKTVSDISKFQNYIPKEINHFLTVYDVKENFYDFFQKHFLADTLDRDLEKSDTIKKSKKI